MNKENEVQDMDFEIKFYEGLIAKNPNFIDALALLGDLYTKTGRYEDGLRMDENLAKLCPDDPVVLYNLACSYSLLNERDKALLHIKRAIRFGYKDFDHLEKDNDLANLRDDGRFKEYFLKVQQKKKEKS